MKPLARSRCSVATAFRFGAFLIKFFRFTDVGALAGVFRTATFGFTGVVVIELVGIKSTFPAWSRRAFEMLFASRIDVALAP